ncbi:BTB/POZ domain-containing protein KCTD6 [Stylophora pistillata]|uniref:BTB/POZ domain-containing protein KCTD6 n=1 Tax=Stylophora pistillata TaxID=50429 RepID=A0A2B4SFF1_STYPI|nr:BTB/POZ domain-containing protein KCTD6 [Stylophora pistillata]
MEGNDQSYPRSEKKAKNMQHGPGIPSIVKLNVGGHYFTTSLRTLTKDPNSMLAVMFAGKFEMKPCEDGAFFIDRDGTHFRFILNYLRLGKLTLPDGATFLKELAEEAEFYQIQGLLDKLKLMEDSLTSVKLNVGGHLFTTSLQTLTKDPKSRLAAMITEGYAENGTLFFDRDGKHFRSILNYLRNGELVLPDDAKSVKQVETEAQFYQIEGILIRLSLFSEILTNEEHITMLLSWLPFHDAGMKGHPLRLLYRASQEGFAAECFHSRCDNKGPTLTIVKSGKNVFGGFTEQSWKMEPCIIQYCDVLLNYKHGELAQRQYCIIIVSKPAQAQKYK